MPAQFTSNYRPGVLQQALGGLAQGAAQSIGRQGAEAVGGLIGTGAQKLGKKIGLTGPSKEAVEFWISQGFKPEEAAQIAAQPIQLQQQLLKEKGGIRRSSAVAQGLRGITGQGGQQGQPGQMQATESQPVEGQPSEGQIIEDIDDDIIRAAEAGATEQDLFNLVKAKQGQQKLGIAERKEERANRAESRAEFAAIKPHIEEWRKAESDVNADEHMMDEVEALYKKGNVQGPVTFKALSDLSNIPVVGGLAAALINPDTQTAQKYLASQVKGFGSTFKGAFNSKELAALEKTIASLMNTKEGVQRIFKAKRYENKLKKLPAQEYEKLRNEYKGHVPFDAVDIVNERVAKRTEELGQKARKLLGFGEQSEGGFKVTGGKLPPEGTILRNKKTGEPEFKIENGKAVPYEG